MRKTQITAVTFVACLDVGRDNEQGVEEGSQGSGLGHWLDAWGSKCSRE